MVNHKLNPFKYGKPVSSEYFFGRGEAIRTIFSRINNGESTAIVGEHHIGKSSFLSYIRDERVRSAWLDDRVGAYAFIDIDCHLLPGSYQPSDFWREVTDHIKEAFSEEELRKQLSVVRQSAFGSFTLKHLFDLLARGGMQVVLLIDEFDVLLHHPNFNTAEFFGALRSLSTRTDGLALVTASRTSIAEMNRRSQEINPIGSPFFNNFTEVRLPPLNSKEVGRLIDRMLEGTGIVFSQHNQAYIRHMSGGNPYLVQMAAAAVFEAIIQEKVGKDGSAAAGRMLRDWSALHFADLWHRLDQKAQMVMKILALAEIKRYTKHQDSLPQRLEQLDNYELELRWLRDLGLIEKTDSTEERDGKEKWRISAGCFVSWIVASGIMTLPSTPQIVDAQERTERIAALRGQIKEKRRRLWWRNEQSAKYGLAVDPFIPNEIEDLEHEIADLEAQLKDLNES